MNQEPLQICLDKKTGGEFFDEILIGRFTRISFHRTLRVPEDGREYPLPAGLGRFPIHRVEDYAEKVPGNWLKEGGFFIPLYQKEALFLQLEGPEWHPTIAKICVGRINAITGIPYAEEISKSRQDYVIIPDQKWLDGICVSEGTVKQFIAMPLGHGYTIEAQISDEEMFGGFQVVAFDSIEGRFPNRDPSIDEEILFNEECERTGIRYQSPGVLYQIEEEAMGIAAGGSIKQSIYKDTYGAESWDPDTKRTLTIHLVNSLAYKAITGTEPPPSPITTAEYQRANIPWYSHYNEATPTVKPPSLFKRILGVSEIEKNRGVSKPEEAALRNVLIQRIETIRTPEKIDASIQYRKRAYDSRDKGFWHTAIREISYVIDLDIDVCAEDYVIRSSCNYQISRYRDGSIDASLGLEKNPMCMEALTWRAFCRKQLGEHQDLDKDADALIKIEETELIGMEMKAEAALLAGRYYDARITAMKLKIKNPGHNRANEIYEEVKEYLI